MLKTYKEDMIFVRKIFVGILDEFYKNESEQDCDEKNLEILRRLRREIYSQDLEDYDTEFIEDLTKKININRCSNIKKDLSEDISSAVYYNMWLLLLKIFEPKKNSLIGGPLIKFQKNTDSEYWEERLKEEFNKKMKYGSFQNKRSILTKSIKFEVFKKYDYKCVECGATKEDCRLEIDHIIPVSRGGSDELSNLQVLCKDCNSAKSNRIINNIKIEED